MQINFLSSRENVLNIPVWTTFLNFNVNPIEASTNTVRTDSPICSAATNWFLPLGPFISIANLMWTQLLWVAHISCPRRSPPSFHKLMFQIYSFLHPCDALQWFPRPFSFYSPISTYFLSFLLSFTYLCWFDALKKNSKVWKKAKIDQIDYRN